MSNAQDTLTWEARQSFLSRAIREIQDIARGADRETARRLDLIVDQLDDFLEETINPEVRHVLDEEERIAKHSAPLGRPLRVLEAERERYRRMWGEPKAAE